MATKGNLLHLELAHLEPLIPHVTEFSGCCKDTIRKLATIGVLQVSTVFEQALAHKMGLTVISEDEADLSDGSDAKLSSVRTSSFGRSYSAPITGLHNKTGDLCVQVYERKQNNFFYFRIPNEAYQHIPKTSNIEIPFFEDGTPKRENRAKVNWWNYEVPSLEDLCR